MRATMICTRITKTLRETQTDLLIVGSARYSRTSANADSTITLSTLVFGHWCK
jgi:hypothetical protein